MGRPISIQCTRLITHFGYTCNYSFSCSRCIFPHSQHRRRARNLFTMNIQSDRPAIIRHIFYIKFIHSSRQTGTQIYRKVFDRRSYDRHFENATTIGYTAMMVTYVMYTHFRLQTKHMWQAWGD